MKNNKISLIFIGIFFLCAGCSFDSKTGIWSGDEKEKERIGQIEKDGHTYIYNEDLFNESGILYRAGVKKYGKEGMKKIQQAAGKRKSHAEIGKINQ